MDSGRVWDAGTPVARPMGTLQIDASRGTSAARLEPAASNARPVYAFFKRCMDISGSLVLGAVLSPVIVVCGVAIRRQGGSVLFSHERVGRDGRRFKVYKFRSMVPDAEAVLEQLLQDHPELRDEWERDHKLRDDPRITPIGKFLRRTSLDELPQLINVLRGEMSLVGPRPITEAEMDKYGRAVGFYLQTKPGITGLWQVSGRNDTHYERRVAMDRYYAERANVMMDIGILLRTVLVVLGRRGAY
jgi:exopolysaccharide production protein ExoY